MIPFIRVIWWKTLAFPKFRLLIKRIAPSYGMHLVPLFDLSSRALPFKPLVVFHLSAMKHMFRAMSKLSSPENQRDWLNAKCGRWNRSELLPSGSLGFIRSSSPVYIPSPILRRSSSGVLGHHFGPALTRLFSAFTRVPYRAAVRRTRDSWEASTCDHSPAPSNWWVCGCSRERLHPTTPQTMSVTPLAVTPSGVFRWPLLRFPLLLGASRRTCLHKTGELFDSF